IRRVRSTGVFGDGVLAAPDLEAVTAVDRLDVEDLAARQAKHALHRRRHVLVHPVRELDHDDRAFPRSPHEATRDRARAFPELAEHDFHMPNLASPRTTSTGQRRAGTDQNAPDSGAEAHLAA